MKVAEVMVTSVLSVGPDASVREVASLIPERRISGLPVVDQEGRIVGIVSEGDLIRRPEIETDHAPAGWLHAFLSDEGRAREFVKSHGRKVREVMTQPAICVAADTPLAAWGIALAAHAMIHKAGTVDEAWAEERTAEDHGGRTAQREKQ